MNKDDIIEHYAHFDEDSRLTSAYGILEEAHTRKLILEQLSSPASVIADVGAGTGHYSAWLAGLGYQVHFSDIVPRHVETFTRRHGGGPNMLSIKTADARNLNYPSNMADLVILNGPLYHLTASADRMQVIAEAERVLRPGGRLLAVTISRFAGLQYALWSGDVFKDAYYQMAKGELKDGIRKNRTKANKTFTTAYFHTQEIIESEIKASKLDVVETLGILGPAWLTPDLESAVNDPGKKMRLLEVAEMMEKHPVFSPKMLSIAVKALG